MADYLTVAELYQMQHRLIEMFGGMSGVRDRAAIEAAMFRPQTGYYNSLEEEAAALMESLGNNHGLLERIAFTAADVLLRRNGFRTEVAANAGYKFTNGSMERREFRFAKILDWLRLHVKRLDANDPSPKL